MARDRLRPACGCWRCDPDARRRDYLDRMADSEMAAALEEAADSGSYPHPGADQP